MKWSSDIAYAVGLLTTDGSLSKDGRHIDLTSKDVEQLTNFKKCLNLKVKIGKKYSGAGNKAYRVQFGNVILYQFLLDIGLTPAKTKTLGEICVPDKYFLDFLRGHFDGDGSFYSYWDKRWENSYMFYTVFISASRKHIVWLQREIERIVGIKGHMNRTGAVYQLRYAKREFVIVLKKMYPKNKNKTYLKRKYLKIQKSLGIIDVMLKCPGGETGIHVSLRG